MIRGRRPGASIAAGITAAQIVMADDTLASLAKIASRLRTARSVEEVAWIAANEARAAIGAHQSSVSLTNGGHALHQTSLSEKYPGRPGRETEPLYPELHHRIGAGDGCLRVAAAELAAPVDAEGPSLRGWLAAPLTDSEGGSVGLIHLSEKAGGEFAPTDEAILSQIAALASLAIDNLRLRASVAAEPPPSAVAHASGKSRFRLLFENNPTPMWVYDQETLGFLEVNEAAQRQYGYTRTEFLAMRITDIRPQEDTPRLIELIKNRPPGLRYVGTWRHCLKDTSARPRWSSAAAVPSSSSPATSPSRRRRKPPCAPSRRASWRSCRTRPSSPTSRASTAPTSSITARRNASST